MIARLRALLLSLLALLLLGQSAAAAAHCLRQAQGGATPSGLVVPICTPGGLVQAHSTHDGQDEAPPVHGEPCVCIVCHLLPQAGLPQPPALPEPAWLLAPRSAPLPPAPPPRPLARAPPGMPRGPPLA
ncbi:MAG TPA: DUF2946 family protein [Roseomonas sp.]|nr:DUF2946 family protein [Roseomonas sp.]